MATTRLTMAQALVTFLTQQYVTRDGVEQQFFAGCFGIFGHGNISGMGQALQQIPALRYYQARNEQGMVHAATAFAKTANRLQTLACTTSIGPGATNMVTGAATATINRLPVLLLPGDIFARRNVDPVLQQLEWQQSRDMSANDCFKPVSRYWDRINRPDQLPSALLEAMRTLTSPADTGAVTLCLPQDVQTEAFEYNSALFEKRVWHIARIRPDRHAITRAATLIKNAQRPLIIAGGGVIYSDATAALSEFVAATGIPVGETMAGKGSLRYAYPQQNMLPSDADGNDVVRLPLDLAGNARSLGADVIECDGYVDLTKAIAQARANRNTTVIYIRNDRYQGVAGYESWWDVPPAEVSDSPGVQAKRREWAEMRATERDYL